MDRAGGSAWSDHTPVVVDTRPRPRPSPHSPDLDPPGNSGPRPCRLGPGIRVARPAADPHGGLRPPPPTPDLKESTHDRKPRLFSGMQPSADSPARSATTSGRCCSGRSCSPSTTRSSASSTCTRSPCPGAGRAAREDPAHRRAVHRRGDRPGLLDAVRAVARGRASAARLDPEHDHRVRRGRPDDAVQGQVGAARRRVDHRRAVRLPDADGRGHPAVRRERGAGGRRPAPARRADPGPGRPVQLAVRRDVRGARSGDPEGDGEDLRPAGSDVEDEQVRGIHLRGAVDDGRPVGQREEDPLGGDG